MLALLLVLSGCVRTIQALSDNDRKKISVVRINNNVQKARFMWYRGPDTCTLFAFGEPPYPCFESESTKLLQDFAEKNGVFIETIVLQEITAAFRESGKLKVSDSGEATETIMNVSVDQYGFTRAVRFSSNLVPTVSIKCEMVDATGKVIWSARNRLSLGGAGRHRSVIVSLEGIRDNPKLIEIAWRGALRQLASEIVKDF